MRMNDMSDYAFRVLIYAAAHRQELFRIADLIEHYQLSQGTLMKVVRMLTQGGYLKAQRGRSGGLMLARAPEEINLGELARYVEPDFAVVECMRKSCNCSIVSTCKLRMPIAKATQAFLDTMDGYTLRDIM